MKNKKSVWIYHQSNAKFFYLSDLRVYSVRCLLLYLSMRLFEHWNNRINRFFFGPLHDQFNQDQMREIESLWNKNLFLYILMISVKCLLCLCFQSASSNVFQYKVNHCSLFFYIFPINITYLDQEDMTCGRCSFGSFFLLILFLELPQAKSY